MSGHGGGPHTSVTFPQSVYSADVADPVSAGSTYGPLRSDDSGALWTAIADPATGLPVDIYRLSADTGDPTQLFARARSLMTGAIGLVPDYGAGQFDVCDRGFLDADALAETRVAPVTLATLSAFSPSNGGFDRIRSLVFGDLIGDAGLDVGILPTAAQLYLGNSTGSLAAGMISADTTAATLNAASDNWLPTASVAYAFNGSSFSRLGTASAGNLSTMLSERAVLATAPGEWTLRSAPAAGVQATATRGGAGRHVLRSITATLIGVDPIAAPIEVVVRDGVSGAGAILWSVTLFAPAANSRDRVTLSGLNIVGSTGSQMTVEFTAAPGANDFESISATGFSAS